MTAARASAPSVGQPASEAIAIGMTANAIDPANSAAATRDAPRESNHTKAAPGGTARSSGQRRAGAVNIAATISPATAASARITTQSSACGRRGSAPPPSYRFTGSRRKNPARTESANAPPATDGAAISTSTSGSNASDQLPCSFGKTKRIVSRQRGVSGEDVMAGWTPHRNALSRNDRNGRRGNISSCAIFFVAFASFA